MKESSQQKEAHQEQFLELGMQWETQELEAQQEELQQEQLELHQAKHQTSSPLELAHAPIVNLIRQVKG